VRYLLLIVLAQLTGCAGSLAWVANHYDRNDICQTREFADNGARLKPANYQQPTGCGGTRVTTGVIRNSQGQQIGVITNR
jgi:hypothetical protein